MRLTGHSVLLSGDESRALWVVHQVFAEVLDGPGEHEWAAAAAKLPPELVLDAQETLEQVLERAGVIQISRSGG